MGEGGNGGGGGKGGGEGKGGGGGSGGSKGRPSSGGGAACELVGSLTGAGGDGRGGGGCGARGRSIDDDAIDATSCSCSCDGSSSCSSGDDMATSDMTHMKIIHASKRARKSVREDRGRETSPWPELMSSSLPTSWSESYSVCPTSLLVSRPADLPLDSSTTSTVHAACGSGAPLACCPALASLPLGMCKLSKISKASRALVSCICPGGFVCAAAESSALQPAHSRA